MQQREEKEKSAGTGLQNPSAVLPRSRRLSTREPLPSFALLHLLSFELDLRSCSSIFLAFLLLWNIDHEFQQESNPPPRTR